MTLDIVTRSELGWPQHPKVPTANTNLGMSAHYDGANQGLAKKRCDACITYWKATRSFHMNTREWSDIGYAYFVCPHGVIFEGRGFGYTQAAQAQQGNRLPNGNTRWITVTFGTGPDEDPTPVQLSAWHRLRNWLRKNKGLGSQVKGHRDFSLTSCPGNRIYKLVTSGVLSTSPTDLEKDDDELASLPLLREGDDNYHVKTLRACLFARGHVPIVLVSDTDLRKWLENTKFDKSLTSVVKDFQKTEKTDVDGLVGPKTWALLIKP